MRFEPSEQFAVNVTLLRVGSTGSVLRKRIRIQSLNTDPVLIRFVDTAQDFIICSKLKNCPKYGRI